MGRIGRAIEIGMMAAAAFRGINACYQKFQESQRAKNTIQIRFKENTMEHVWLSHWITRQPGINETTKGRVLNVFSEESFPSEPMMTRPSGGVGVSVDTRVKWFLVPESVDNFVFEGLVLSIGRPAPAPESKGVPEKYVVLTVVTKDLEAVARLLDSIAECHKLLNQKDKTPYVFCTDFWGNWNRSRAVDTNRLPVLPDNLLDTLVKDMQWFESNKEWYQSVGVPWRRGYLFHGVSGSGKTTTAICLAAKTQRDIYIIPLEGMNDERLSNAIRNSSPTAILLLEDMDCVGSTHRRTGDAPAQDNGIKDRPTLGGLLNALDGVTTPEGRIVIGTTNRVGDLDDALTRPGRFDLSLEFGYATTPQIEELARRFGVEDPEAFARGYDQVSMAKVQGDLIVKCGINPQKNEIPAT